MEIRALLLKHYGKFEHHRIDLKPGINVIYGGNETGKSTVHSFICAMLFGLQRSRGRAAKTDEYQIRQPWDTPGAFTGSMWVQEDGQIYRIDRCFDRSAEPLQVTNETEGWEAKQPQETLDALLGGISEAAFVNTVFIPQAHCETDEALAQELRRYMINSDTSADGQTDVTRALENLRRKKRLLEQQKKKEDAQTEARIEKVQAQAERLRGELVLLQEQLDYETGGAVREDNRRQSSHGRKDGRDWNSSWVDRGRKAGRDWDDSLGERGRKVRQDRDDGLGEHGRKVRQDRDDSLGERGRKAGRDWDDDFDDNWDDGWENGPESAGSGQLPELLLFVFGFLALAGAYLRPEWLAKLGLGALGAVLLLLIFPVHARRQKREKGQETSGGWPKAGTAGQMPSGEYRTGTAGRTLPEPYAGQPRPGTAGQMPSGEYRTGTAGRTLPEPYAGQPRQGTAGQMPPDRRRAGVFPALPDQDREQHLREEIRRREEAYRKLQNDLETLYHSHVKTDGTETEIAALTEAIDRICALSSGIYAKSGGRLNQRASEILAGITQGRYSRIVLDKTAEVRIYTPERVLGLHQVSGGTMQQIYFALRMASGELLGGGRKLPVILDETFALYDDARLEAALRWLKKSGKQVILFSCQKREREILERL